MIDEIVAFGCSYTKGDGVAHHRSWPYCLGFNLNITTRNYGIGGSSNKVISSEFFKNFELEMLKNSLVVIGWTGHIRTAFWDEDSKEWDHVLVQHFTEKEKRRRDIDYYYSNIYTEYSAYYESVIIKMAVQNALEKYKIPYIFFNALHPGPFEVTADDTLRKMYGMLENNRYIEQEKSAYEWIMEDKEKYVCDDGFHPSEEGHILISQKITHHIKENNLLEMK